MQQSWSHGLLPPKPSAKLLPLSPSLPFPHLVVSIFTRWASWISFSSIWVSARTHARVEMDIYGQEEVARWAWQNGATFWGQLLLWTVGQCSQTRGAVLSVKWEHGNNLTGVVYLCEFGKMLFKIPLFLDDSTLSTSLHFLNMLSSFLVTPCQSVSPL